MRAILLDWMMEVSCEFAMKRQTYYLAINYVDRYLMSVSAIPKTQLQLVGVTSLYLASKIEEVYLLKVSDFAKSTDNGYTSEEIIAMEK